MQMRYFAAIAAVSALFAGPVMAQNTMSQGSNDKTAAPDQPTKQGTQGVPPSMNNPQYGGGGAAGAAGAASTQASKQRTQGVPSTLNNPQYGGGAEASKQRTQGVPSALNNPQYGGAEGIAKKQQ